MKKILFSLLLTSPFFLLSCSDDDDPTPQGGTDKYMSITAGSTWNYTFTDNLDAANNESYTVTSTNRDTVVSGKTYHILSSSNGDLDYYNITGSDYYTLQTLPLGITDTTLANLYLKDGAAVNFAWQENYTIDAGVPVEVVIVNRIDQKGINKTVAGKDYTNVIHVVTTISSPTIATLPGSSISTDIHSFYAPKVGLIQSDAKVDLVIPILTIDDHTDNRTVLTAANIL